MASEVPDPDDFYWSTIIENVVNHEKLRLLCHHEKALKREGYVTSPLTEQKLLTKLRCQNCQKHIKPPLSDALVAAPNRFESNPANNDNKPDPAQVKKKRDLCVFHPGRVVRLHFQCCQAHVSVQEGCREDPTHKIHHDYQNMLASEWTYYSIPFTTPQPAQSSSHVRSRRKPRFINKTGNIPRTAIALDCEFGISTSNEPELIRLTAIDFFTREVLIDSLVKPSVYVKNFNTRYSGVSALDMRDAVQRRQCIFGRDEARTRLMSFLNSETILIVHGGSSDLSSLRLIHPNIVDTSIVETYFEKLEGGRSLKNLCEKKFGIKIQRGRRGHDSLEDALSCRELAYWMMKLIPDD